MRGTKGEEYAFSYSILNRLENRKQKEVRAGAMTAPKAMESNSTKILLWGNSTFTPVENLTNYSHGNSHPATLYR